MKNNVFIIISTFSNKKESEQICKKLLKKKLIGCGQISSPITSMYHWEGKIVYDEEFILSVKTTQQNHAKVLKYINKKHSYDTPEIITIKPDYVNSKYERWLQEVIKENG